MSYWEDMPVAIVVGIKQLETRRDDCQYDDNTGLPGHPGEKFYDFVSTELLAYLNENFRLAKFRMIVGHDYTSNFINYFIDDSSLFQAYINLSPEYAPSMTEKLPEILSALPYKTCSFIWETFGRLNLTTI